MFTDDNLVFCDKEDLTNFAGGVVGEVLDLNGEKRLGEGHPFYIYVASSVDMTATGDPAINLTMETSNDELFPAGDTIEHPLFPELSKEDFATGGHPLYAHCPFGTKRYARLKLDTSGPIACGEISAGFTLNVQTNV